MGTGIQLLSHLMWCMHVVAYLTVSEDKQCSLKCN